MNVKEILTKHNFNYVIKQTISLCDTHLDTYKMIKNVDFYEKNTIELLRDFLQLCEDEYEKENSDYLEDSVKILIEIQDKIFNLSVESKDVSRTIKKIVMKLTPLTLINKELEKGGFW